LKPLHSAALAKSEGAIAIDGGIGRGCQQQGLNVAKAGKDQAHPILTTKRLRLRRFDARDLAGLHACFGDAEAMRYWNLPPSQSEAESARRLKTLEKRKSPYSFLAWAVADKKSNECIGMVNYHHREAHNRRLEVGYILCPKRQGKGLMSEAMRAPRLLL
jgi:[ribosomal protein S5]-alanine N-acetyltransferase